MFAQEPELQALLSFAHSWNDCTLVAIYVALLLFFFTPFLSLCFLSVPFFPCAFFERPQNLLQPSSECQKAKASN